MSRFIVDKSYETGYLLKELKNKSFIVVRPLFKGNTSDGKTVSEQIRILAKEFGVKHVTIVGDRGMLKGPQIEDLPEDFWYITAISKPQIRKLIEKGGIQYELFDEKVSEVEIEGVRYILRRNPYRQQEMRASREKKFRAVEEFVERSNEYLKAHPRAKAQTQLRRLEKFIEKLKISKWVKAAVVEGKLALERDEEALQEIEKLDGCYVIKSNVPKDEADAQVLHDRYTDLELIERDFRTIKQTHLELRPVYVRKQSHTKGHVFVVMLALLIQRKLEEYSRDLDITVKEGLDTLSLLSVHKLYLRGEVVSKVPNPKDMASKLLKRAGVSCLHTSHPLSQK